MSKKFIMVSHESFVKIEKLLWDLKEFGEDEAISKKLNNLLKAGIYTELNPVEDDESAPGMLYDGNIILEYPSGRAH